MGINGLVFGVYLCDVNVISDVLHFKIVPQVSTSFNHRDSLACQQWVKIGQHQVIKSARSSQ